MVTGRMLSTGAERVVGAEEMFFSTTDRRGVIRAGNSVFVRISGYSLDELVGAPHNLVRHPDMPAGAFRLMWDRLSSGHPMAAYVENLARDGSSYWVFATVTPLGDGYLSVRAAPRSALFDAARRVYRQVRDYEQALAGFDGSSGPAVALAGAQELGRVLGTLGYPSYDDFMLEALPAEVAARSGPAAIAYARPRATGPMAEVLSATHALDVRLAGLVALLDGYRQLSASLAASAQAVQHIADTLAHSVDAAAHASAQVTDVPVLANVARVMATPMGSAVDAFGELAPRLAALQQDVAALRLRIALARLHTEMVAAFACEVVDGTAPDGTLGEVPLLCDALHDGVVDMAATATAVTAGLDAAAKLVTRAGDLLDDFRRFLGQWRILVMRHRKGNELAGYVDPIDDQLNAAHDQVEHLRDLGRRCRTATVPLDVEELEADLQRIRTAAGG